MTGWLAAKPVPWLAGIRHVVIDPYQPYATAAVPTSNGTSNAPASTPGNNPDHTATIHHR